MFESNYFQGVDQDGKYIDVHVSKSSLAEINATLKQYRKDHIYGEHSWVSPSGRKYVYFVSLDLLWCMKPDGGIRVYRVYPPAEGQD